MFVLFLFFYFFGYAEHVCICVCMQVFTCVGAHISGHMCVLHGWADLRLTLEIFLECSSSELIQAGSLRSGGPQGGQSC